MSTPQLQATAPSRRRWPWLSLGLALLAASSWALFYNELIGGPFASAALLLAGPVALAGLVVGITHTVRRATPWWFPVLGILASLGALAYIGAQFLHILAIIAFV